MPISETVNSLLDDMDHGSGSFYAALEASILKQFKLLIRRSDWSDNLPLHLQPRFLLFDDAGNELCTGRDLRDFLHHHPAAKSRYIHLECARQIKNLLDRWDGTTHTTGIFRDYPTPSPPIPRKVRLPVSSTRYSWHNLKTAGSELPLKKTRESPKN